jgi:hypothetical protein
MNRTVAVQRINEGLGFMADGNALEAKIILRLQEAQRDLEKGKTLPKFLLQEDQTLSFLSGDHTVALPDGFLRLDDEVLPHFTPSTSDLPTFLTKKSYMDAVVANILETNEAVAPSVFVLRRTVIDFITTADQDYTLLWNYYKAADALTTDIENAWLENAPEWLIGEAGYRIAQSARDSDAMAIFEDIRKRGRAAIFAEDLLQDESGGPFVMGANL